MPQTQTPLGSTMQVMGFMLAAPVPEPDRCELILRGLVEHVGMRTGGLKAQVWLYPTPDGCGGQGATVVQPLLESFAVFTGIDTWPCIGHWYLFLCTCRPVAIDFVSSFLTEELGFGLLASGEFRLSEAEKEP